MAVGQSRMATASIPDRSISPQWPSSMLLATAALQLPSCEVGNPEKLHVQPGWQLQNSKPTPLRRQPGTSSRPSSPPSRQRRRPSTSLASPSSRPSNCRHASRSCLRPFEPTTTTRQPHSRTGQRESAARPYANPGSLTPTRFVGNEARRHHRSNLSHCANHERT